MEQTTTDRLGEILRSAGTKQELEEYLAREDARQPYGTFIDYFRSLPETRSLTAQDLYKAAGIERSYCYHIWDGKKKPGRDKIIRLCLAAGLDCRQVKRALECGGQPTLYPRNTRDAVLIHCVETRAGVNRADALLDELGLEPLG